MSMPTVGSPSKSIPTLPDNLVIQFINKASSLVKSVGLAQLESQTIESTTSLQEAVNLLKTAIDLTSSLSLDKNENTLNSIKFILFSTIVKVFARIVALDKSIVESSAINACFSRGREALDKYIPTEQKKQWKKEELEKLEKEEARIKELTSK